MLSDRERKALEELELSLAADTESVGRQPSSRGWAGRWPPGSAAAVLIGAVSLVVLLAGAPSGGFSLAVAGALGFLLWRYWPQLRDEGAPALREREGGEGDGSGARPIRAARRCSTPRRRAD